MGFVLDKSTSSLVLGECNRVFASKPVDILLAAVMTSFGRIFSDRQLPTVFLEGHGREPWSPSIDILRTVGWFTTLFPISMAREEAGSMATAVRSAKDRRNRFSDNGFATFSCSQMLAPSSSAQPGSPVAEVTLNFVGQYQQLEKDDALFREAEIDMYTQQESSQERFSLVNINVQVRDGSICFDLSYHRQTLKQDLIAHWVEECQGCLREAGATLTNLSRIYTPGDFPLLQTTDQELQILLEDRLPSLGIDIESVDDMSLCSPTQLDMLNDEENAIGHHVTRLNFEVTTTNVSEVIDANLLSRAFRALVDRHPILRTVFVPMGGRLVQLVLKHFSPDIIINRDDPGESNHHHTDAVYKKLHGAQAPYQIIFHHLPARNTVLISIDISHALIDGASMAILLRDWNLAYQNKLSGGTAPSFQKLISHMQYQSFEAAKSYWTQHLLGIQSCLIPLDGSGIKCERQQRFIRLNLPAMQILQESCKQISITLPNLIHAVWSIALHVVTKSSHIAFGYLVSGRDVPLDVIEDAVGPNFNLLVSRYNLDGTQPLRAVLQMVQGVMTERLPFQNFSWPQMQQQSESMSSATVPVFNTMINIHRFEPLVAGENSRLKFTAKPGYDPLAVSKFPSFPG